jgi:hypothetical protein
VKTFLVVAIAFLIGCASSPHPRPESRPAAKTPESVPSPESAPESAESKPTVDADATYSAISSARDSVVYDGASLASDFKCGSVDATRRVEEVRAAVLAVMNLVCDLEAAASKELRVTAEADAARFKTSGDEFALLCRDTAVICESESAEIACVSAIHLLLFAVELYAEALTVPSP